MLDWPAMVHCKSFQICIGRCVLLCSLFLYFVVCVGTCSVCIKRMLTLNSHEAECIIYIVEFSGMARVSLSME